MPHRARRGPAVHGWGRKASAATAIGCAAKVRPDGLCAAARKRPAHDRRIAPRESALDARESHWLACVRLNRQRQLARQPGARGDDDWQHLLTVGDPHGRGGELGRRDALQGNDGAVGEASSMWMSPSASPTISNRSPLERSTQKSTKRELDAEPIRMGRSRSRSTVGSAPVEATGRIVRDRTSERARRSWG